MLGEQQRQALRLYLSALRIVSYKSVASDGGHQVFRDMVRREMEKGRTVERRDTMLIDYMLNKVRHFHINIHTCQALYWMSRFMNSSRFAHVALPDYAGKASARCAAEC